MSELHALPDERLVLLVQATADSSAYTELVKRHQDALLAFLHRFTGNRALAEDLTQDAFLKAYQKISRFRKDATFRTWLFTIGYREFLQHTRKSGVISRMLQAFHLQGAPDTEAPTSLGIDLDKGLAQLPEKERAALLLCDVFGMTHTEASQAMDTPLGSVKTYVRRARKLMQGAMEPAEATNPEPDGNNP